MLCVSGQEHAKFWYSEKTIHISMSIHIQKESYYCCRKWTWKAEKKEKSTWKWCMLALQIKRKKHAQENKTHEEVWGLGPCGSIIIWDHRIIKRKAYSLDSGPQMNIDGEVDLTAMREKDKRWSKGKSRRENEKGNDSRQKTEMNEAKLYREWVSMDQLIDLCHFWGIREYGWVKVLGPFVIQM